MSVTTASVPVH